MCQNGASVHLTQGCAADAPVDLDSAKPYVQHKQGG